jgi:hypothetical protein
MSYDTESDSSTDSGLPTCECCGEAYTHTTCDGANATRSCGCSTTPLTDGGRVPQSFEALAATCETCGGDVEPQYLEDGECPGCLYGEPLTDGGEDLLDVCPDCDGSSIKSNAGGGFGGRPSTGRGRYFCSDCGTHFEEPATRPRRGKPVRRGLAGKLADPDVGPDDLVTDGGAREQTIQNWLVINWQEATTRTRKSKPDPSSLGTQELATSLTLTVTIPEVEMPDLVADIEVPQARVEASELSDLSVEDSADWRDVADAVVDEHPDADPFEDLDRLVVAVLEDAPGRPDIEEVKRYLRSQVRQATRGEST